MEKSAGVERGGQRKKPGKQEEAIDRLPDGERRAKQDEGEFVSQSHLTLFAFISLC